ncbi:MAG: DUF1285 domain-containing protein [Paracoccus sp. (in: a-proteobacteria)]|nr:DUF1285 domain-containing protein [Paracoccus sp. (in: a-proteobacteria)]
MGKPTETTNKHAPAADRARRASGELLPPAASARGPAPVHLWDPPYCGEMDLEIRADGSWLHEGRPIARPEMVRMFANILKFEDGRHYLVTPVEKLGIRVEDAPFVVTDVEILPGRVEFVTNIGDRVTLDSDHPLDIAGSPDAPRPYVTVRGGLRALIDRKTYYRLADAALSGPDGRLGLHSAGMFFPLEG